LFPVGSAREKLATGEYELMEAGRADRAERAFLLAAQADPWSAAPYRYLAQLAFRTWFGSQRKDDGAFARSVRFQKEAIDRDPRQYSAHEQLGEMYLAKFARSDDHADANAAVAAFEAAAALYPNHAATQSSLADALGKAGRREHAQQAARRALALDSINEQAGHIDKQLPVTRKDLMQKLLEKAN
jgi:tetratricopeptide (TPR) repeat protein